MHKLHNNHISCRIKRSIIIFVFIFIVCAYTDLILAQGLANGFEGSGGSSTGDEGTGTFSGSGGSSNMAGSGGGEGTGSVAGSGGGGHDETPFLNVIANTTKNRIFRGDDVEVHYFIYFEKYDLDTSEIKITYPSQFIDISSINTDLVINSDGIKFKSINNEKIKPEKSPLEIKYIATVSKNSTLERYNLSENFIYSKDYSINSMEIEIINNLPNVTFSLGGDCSLREEYNYTCYNQSEISLSYIINDSESNGISCSISANDSENWSFFSKNYSDKTHYYAANSDCIKFNLSAEDADGGKKYHSLILEVSQKTWEQSFSENYPWYFVIITFILIIIFYILKPWLNAFPIGRIMEISKTATLIFGMGSIPLASYFKILNIIYILILYTIIFFFIIIFLELDYNFSQFCQDVNRSHKMKNGYYLWDLLIKHSLGIIAISGMFIAAMIVSWLLPMGFLKQDGDILQSYIFYYYTAIIMLFGTILTIVSMFTIWYLQEGKIIEKYTSIIKLKLEDFMFLHMVIIVTALGGLALGEVPHLDVGDNVLSSYASIASILAFQTTMMLIVPSLVALYKITCWFMNPNLREKRHTFWDFFK